jgi:hypothetical protein
MYTLEETRSVHDPVEIAAAFLEKAVKNPFFGRYRVSEERIQHATASIISIQSIIVVSNFPLPGIFLWLNERIAFQLYFTIFFSASPIKMIFSLPDVFYYWGFSVI